VFARDAVSGAWLPGVNISYQCVNFRCDIGTTAYPRAGGLLTGASPILRASFPECSGGLVIAERPGYHIARQQATVSQETNQAQVIVDMYPEKQFPFKVMVVQDHNNVINIRNPEPDEEIVISIEEPGQMFEQDAIYPSENFRNISLMVGDFTYELDLKLVSESYYLGGLDLNWTVTKGQLQDSSYLVFYVIKKDPPIPPQSAEEYMELYDYARRNSAKYPPELR
jgi:hypothetical protein